MAETMKQFEKMYRMYALLYANNPDDKDYKRLMDKYDEKMLAWHKRHSR